MSTFFTQMPGILTICLACLLTDLHDRHPELLTPREIKPVLQPFAITAYSPDSNDGISGSGPTASGKPSYVGAAACPRRLKFGTRVVLAGKARARAEKLGLPWDLTCEDRFRNVYREGIDINIPLYYLNLSSSERILLAKQFGLVNGEAYIYETD